MIVRVEARDHRVGACSGDGRYEEELMADGRELSVNDDWMRLVKGRRGFVCSHSLIESMWC